MLRGVRKAVNESAGTSPPAQVRSRAGGWNDRRVDASPLRPEIRGVNP